MDFKKFSLLIAMRTILAMLTLIFLTQAVIHDGYHATVLLLSTVLLIQFFEFDIVRFISKRDSHTTKELSLTRAALNRRMEKHGL